MRKRNCMKKSTEKNRERQKEKQKEKQTGKQTGKQTERQKEKWAGHFGQINWKGILVGTGLVALFAGYHVQDVRAGAIATGDRWLIFWYLVLAIVAVAGVFVLGYGFFGKRRESSSPIALERVYPVAGLLLGLLSLFILPPLSAPDEISHYVSAYQLSSHLIGKQATDRYGRVLLRPQDVWVEDLDASHVYEIGEDGTWKADVSVSGENRVIAQPLEEGSYRQIHEIFESGVSEYLLHTELGETEADSLFPPVTTTPLAYLPQAIGMAAARLLGLGTLPLLYLGRICNLIFFVVMTTLAMRRLPFGKEVLFGVALLPMTIHLSASYSYDVMIMSCFFVFTAVCLDLACARENVRKRDVALLAVLMAVAGPCKMVYAPMMGLCLLIPIAKFGTWKKWMISAIAVGLAFALAMFLVNRQVIASYAAATETDSFVEWASEPGYTLTLLIHQPQRLVKIFYQTILWQTQQYHLTMIGASLGNLDPVLDVPYVVVMTLSLCLLGLAFRKPGESLYFSGGQRIWIGVVCAGCAGLVMLSMLIAWTPLSSRVINGVQGRYFLPFLPVLLLALKNDTVVLTKNLNRSILYLMCCLDAYALIRLYSVVSMRV